MKFNARSILILLSAIVFSSCGSLLRFEKRKYRPGFYLEGKSNVHASAKITPDASSGILPGKQLAEPIAIEKTSPLVTTTIIDGAKYEHEKEKVNGVKVDSVIYKKKEDKEYMAAKHAAIISGTGFGVGITGVILVASEILLIVGAILMLVGVTMLLFAWVWANLILKRHKNEHVFYGRGLAKFARNIVWIILGVLLLLAIILGILFAVLFF